MHSPTNLRNLMLERNISASALAKEIGLHRQTISSHLYGAEDFTGRVLIRLADYFGVTTDYILGRTNKRGE